MKKISTLTVAALLVLSLSAFAAEPGAKSCDRKAAACCKEKAECKHDEKTCKKNESCALDAKTCDHRKREKKSA